MKLQMFIYSFGIKKKIVKIQHKRKAEWAIINRRIHLQSRWLIHHISNFKFSFFLQKLYSSKSHVWSFLLWPSALTPILLSEPPALNSRNWGVQERCISVNKWIDSPPYLGPHALMVTSSHRGMIHEFQELPDRFPTEKTLLD